MAQAQQEKQELVRKDPVASRSHRLGSVTIINKREDRRYMIANPNEPMFGVEAMLACGWHFVDRNADKERILGGGPSRDDKSKESYGDQILMWIEADIYEAGEAAKFQENAELMSRTARQGGIDAVRGSDGAYASPSVFKTRG